MGTGICRSSVTHRGLWAVNFQMREEVRGYQTHPPYIGQENRVILRFLHCCRCNHRWYYAAFPTLPGNVQVEMRDAGQKPVRGFVELISEGDLPLWLSGATDARAAWFSIRFRSRKTGGTVEPVSGAGDGSRGAAAGFAEHQIRRPRRFPTDDQLGGH